MVIWGNFKNFVSSSQRTNGRLGIAFQILYFAVKKRMAVWVHGLVANPKNNSKL